MSISNVSNCCLVAQTLLIAVYPVTCTFLLVFPLENQYADMSALKENLDLQTYDLVRGALGLEPLPLTLFTSLNASWSS